MTLSDGTTGSLWSESVALGTATAATSTPLDGKPAITRNDLGRGRAHDISKPLSPAVLGTRPTGHAARAGARPVLGSAAPAGVEAIRRNGRRGSYLFC